MRGKIVIHINFLKAFYLSSREISVNSLHFFLEMGVLFQTEGEVSVIMENYRGGLYNFSVLTI